jgi:hypothetical protein
MRGPLVSALFYLVPGIILFSDSIVATGIFSGDSAVENAMGTAVSTRPCTPIEFNIKFDEYPMEVSYQLVCDDKIVWFADKGKFQKLFATHDETACVVSAKECKFTIWDNPDYGDGLSSPYSYQSGNFKLSVNGVPIFAYDGKVAATANYYELSSPTFCIGSIGCNQCVETTLNLTLDGNPSDTGYTLYCGDEELWNKPLNSFRKSQGWARAEVFEQVCVPQSACCWFMLVDSPKPIRFQLSYG